MSRYRNTIKSTTSEAGLKLEAWIKFALLPGVYVGELGDKGIMGAVPKKHLRDRIKAIEALV